MTDDILRQRVQFVIAAQLMDKSCECCKQREFDFLAHDLFICEGCAI
jgi:ribosomal protein L37AE/L43A